MVVYVNFCKDICMFEAAMAFKASENVLLHNGIYYAVRWRRSTLLPALVDIYLSSAVLLL